MKRFLLILVLILVLSVSLTAVDVSADPPPAPHTNLQATDGTEIDTVWLTWTYSPDSTKTRIERKATGASVWTLLTTNWTGNAYEDTTATHDILWRYRVFAIGDSLSVASNVDTGYVGLAVPTNVQATDGTHLDKVCITWDEVDGATGYEVRVGNTPHNYLKTVDATGYGAVPFCDYGLDPGVLYYFWVRATNSVAESEYSDHDTGYRRLASPANVEATDGAFCDKARVTWDPVDGALGGVHQGAWADFVALAV